MAVPPALPPILFEDPHLVALDKPAGVPTQSTASGEPGLEQSLRKHLSEARGSAVYLGTVHRLDLPVSGVLLWAKTPKAARRLSEQFALRETIKQYWAVVEGEAPGGQTLWDDFLARDDSGGGRYARIAPEGTPGARRASTRVEIGRAGKLPEGCAFLRLFPETGRTHQLRVQAAARGLPILGDHTYGASGRFPIGIALHARRLAIRHPITGLPMVFEAPLPPSWGDRGIEIAEVEPPA